jgi:hypothetical protein
MMALLALPLAASGRRRTVRKTPAVGVPTNPGGDCHTFGLVKSGLKATYLSTTSNGSAAYTITYISDTPTQTKTTQVVSTPQGNADAVTTIDGEVVGLLRGMKHIDVSTSITVPILGKVTTEVDVDFTPSLVLGPAEGWCVGKTWNVAPVTETVVTKAPLQTPITNIMTTVGGTGEVLAVGENVTVPAGVFKTVKYRGVLVANNSVQPAITWASMDHSIVVKQQSLDPVTGAVTTNTELTGLVVPANVLHLPDTEASDVPSGTND